VYETLYDIRQVSPINWTSLLFGSLVVAYGIFYVAAHRNKPPEGRPRWFPVAWLSFAIVWTLLSVGLPFHSSVTHAKALDDGNIRVVEGPIKDFHSQKDCKREQFSVAGQSFEYSKYEEMGRFNQPAPCGGPLRPGMFLRISYVGAGDIVRIERRIDTGREAR